MRSEPERVPAPSAYTVGAAFPHPHAADPGQYATRWGAPPTDYAADPAAGQTASWTESAGEPALHSAAVEPVTMRVGWLERGRSAPEPGAGGDAA
jgi:hypothetical protein